MKKIQLLILVSLLFASCGKTGQGESTDDFGFTSSSQFQSGACGHTVVHDYNMMAIDCSYMYSRSSIDECIGMIEGFMGKYPGINCTAVIEENYNEIQIQITDGLIQGFLEEAQNL